MHSSFHGSTTSILCILCFLFVVRCANKELENQSLQTIYKPFVGIELPKTVVEVNPEHEQKILLEKGMILDLPGSAFIDETGKTVQKPVTLTVEYYHSASEIIASGIPMTYEENGNVSHFESAGMFKIEGMVDGMPVFIDSEKEIYINSVSSVYGNYDVYYFQERNTSSSSSSGNWTRVATDTANIPQALDTFRVQFDTVNYPELTNLAKINWQLADTVHNPNNPEYQWILEETWTSVQVSQPKFGIGERLLTTPVDEEEYLGQGSVLTNRNGTRIITTHQSTTRIWNERGGLLKTINDVENSGFASRIVDDSYVVVRCKENDVLYDLDGNKICILESHSYEHRISAKHKTVIYKLARERGKVHIKDFNGKKIKVLELENLEHDYGYYIGTKYAITPEGLLLTNSIDGIHFYDLNGKLLKHRDGEYQTFIQVNKDLLLLKEISGQLTLWNHRDNMEVTSKREDFDLSTKYVGNRLEYSYFYPIKEKGLVMIQEANKAHSKLWNTLTNTTSSLPFGVNPYPKELWKNGLLEGYDRQKNEYHLYDIQIGQSIITIPNFEMCLYCDIVSDYYASLSDNNEFLIIQNEDHARLYTVTGKLVTDFKSSDSLTFKAGFLSDSTFFSLTSTGVLRHWNTQGEEISQIQLAVEAPIYGLKNQEQLITFNSIIKERSAFHLTGELYYAIPYSRLRKIVDPLAFLYESETTNEINLDDSFRLNPYTYQLTLRSGGKTFVTYVYLDDEKKRLINVYSQVRSSRINQEFERRTQELKVRRKLRVANFGIYNWDRLIDKSGLLTIKATFDFDMDMSFTDARVFHLTEIDGQAILEYGKDGSSNFSFDQNAPNQLIAVLPQNKIALFSQSSFDHLDYEAIRTSGAYTFKMVTQPDSLVNLDQLAKMLD